MFKERVSGWKYLIYNNYETFFIENNPGNYDISLIKALTSEIRWHSGYVSPLTIISLFFILRKDDLNDY